MTLEEFQVEAKKHKVGRGQKPKPYTAEQKNFAKVFAEKALSEGMPRSAIIRRLGISATALKKWTSSKEKESTGGFRRVDVSYVGQNTNLPVLITPTGYRVEGISIENLAYLLRML